MRLEKCNAGRTCPSDAGIRFGRGGGACRPDGTKGDGWEVQVRRPPQRRVLCYVARNLMEAKKWAREHWRPYFLDDFVANLPPQHPAHSLYREAVLGDPTAFF